MKIRKITMVLMLASYIMVLSNVNLRAETTSSDVDNAACKVSQHVSIIQIISNPEKFHGKCVLVIGFAHFEFEGDIIYLHEEDYKHGLTKNGLWLSIPENRYEEYAREFNNKYTLVEGTFDARKQGHGSLTSGTIENIKRLQELVIPRALNDEIRR